MLPTRREIILSAPALPALALPPAESAAPSTIAQIVHRLEELWSARDATFDQHAEPLGAAVAAGEAYFASIAPIEEEYQRLVRLLVATPATTAAELRLKAKVAGWHNVFPCPANLCPADALVWSLLSDLEGRA